MYLHRYPLGFGLLELELTAALLTSLVGLVMLAFWAIRLLGSRRKPDSD